MYSRLIPLRQDNVDNVAASDLNTLEDFLRGLANGDYTFHALKIEGSGTDWVAQLPILKEFYDARGSAEGPVITDSNNKIPTAQLPALATTEVYTAASEAAQLGLTVQSGDMCVRTDLEQSYIALNSDNADMGDWQLLQSPTDAVQSVDGRTGTVSLSDRYEPKDTDIQDHIGDSTIHLSSTQKTDLTNGGESSAHYHSADRARANHTGSQAASTISDFDTEVANNTNVAANTSHRGDDTKHREINDSGESTTELWSSSKITSMITGAISIEDTPVNGHTAQAISSNWAYDHSRDSSTFTTDGFWGEVFWASNTTIVIRPKEKNGQKFIGAMLNTGEYLKDTTRDSITVTLDTTSFDRIGVVQNDSWYILYAYKNTSGNLAFGFGWMPSVNLGSYYPTNLVTLGQLNYKDIKSLFPVGGEVSLFESSTKFETPIYSTAGGFNAAKTTCKIIAHPSTNVIQLAGSLSVANFVAGGATEVYLTSGFQPIDRLTGIIASRISGNSWCDTGLRIMTDGSGNIYNFMIDNETFYFTNGTGSETSTHGTWKGQHTFGSTQLTRRATYAPVDKTPNFIIRYGNYTVYTKPYWETYYEVVGGISTTWTMRVPMKVKHGLYNIYGSGGTGYLGVEGYKI